MNSRTGSVPAAEAEEPAVGAEAVAGAEEHAAAAAVEKTEAFSGAPLPGYPARFPQLAENLDFRECGTAMHAWMAEVFPLCRSITGDGLRETLAILGEHIPLTLFEVPSGTEVFDWTVPREWNIRDAWIKDSAGDAIVEFRAPTCT